MIRESEKRKPRSEVLCLSLCDGERQEREPVQSVNVCVSVSFCVSVFVCVCVCVCKCDIVLIA